MKLLLTLLLLLVILSPGTSMAYNGGYSPGYEPYRENDGVKPYPLTPFQQDPNEHTEYDLFRSDNFAIRLDRSVEPPLLKISKDGKELKSFDLPSQIDFPYLNEAYRGDLNHDNMADYICVFGGTGCGLASEYCHALFVFSGVFSGKKEYTVQTLHTMGFGPEDVVDWNGDGKCTIIHTWFVYGENGKDGEDHNYWVYNFLDVAEGGLILSEDIPWKWIIYTFKPNHEDTDQLTDKQKIRCWLRATIDLFSD